MRGMVFMAAVLIAAPVTGQEVERISGGDVAVYNLAGHVEAADPWTAATTGALMRAKREMAAWR